MRLDVAVVGVGNCFAGLYQGIEYYKKTKERVKGVVSERIGKYDVRDINFCAAFDVAVDKVGKPLSEAVMSGMNYVDWTACQKSDVVVSPAPVLDGIGRYLKTRVKTIKKRTSKADVLKVLGKSGAEVIVNLLPVGSDKATQFWANVALEAKIPMVNCIPSFIASDRIWANKFRNKKVAIIGDDVKGAFGSTIVHRAIMKLIDQRGLSAESTYQLNVGGNSDFLNMLEKERLKSKKISKTEAVESQIPGLKKTHIGPSDYVPFLKNTKIAYINVKGNGWADVPFELEMKLVVDDKSNSAPIIADCVRIVKCAQEKGLYGPLEAPSGYYMKRPPKQMGDLEAKKALFEMLKKF